MISVVLERCAGVDVHRDTVAVNQLKEAIAWGLLQGRWRSLEILLVCWMWGAANQEAHWEMQKLWDDRGAAAANETVARRARLPGCGFRGHRSVLGAGV
jgi:hypothetical protein